MQTTTNEQFRVLLNADRETEHLEFKTAETGYNFNTGKKSLCGYATALANEGGGKLILGVTDKRPRIPIGTKAFPNTAKLEKDLFKQLRRRVRVEELFCQGKRVLIIHIPSRPIGEAIDFEGQYLMRLKDELLPMSPDTLKEIINEAVTDYSSKVLTDTNINDLDTSSIQELRKLLKNSTRVDKDIDQFTDEQMLQDLGLVEHKNLTIAALVLLGTETSLKKFLPHAEIRYGYKTDENQIRNQESIIFKMGYLGYYNKLWEKINGRNLSVHMQNGLVVTERKVFEEETIREAINNAIIHRDYSEAETIRIIQTPYKLNIVSPGGFPHGVNLDNIADTTKTRNKLIADVLYKCEFVEQFGNGVNLMIKNQLSLGKPPPDYFKSDKFRVDLNIDGNIKDIEFAKYVMRIAEKLNVYLNDEELRLLYDIKENHKVHNLELANKLVELGIVEKLGINKFLLSKQYYAYINKRGIYTRRRGLDKETNKKLILEHLRHHQKGYMPDLIEALKNVPKSTINSYLSELREEGLIELAGKPSATSGANRAYWKIKKTV